MTNAFYKRFPALLLTLFIPVYVLNQYGDNIGWLVAQPVLAFAIGCAEPILSLCFLYFGIYAHVCRIKTKRKFEGPVVWIVFGSIFTLLSFGPPIFLWASLPEAATPSLSVEQLQELRESALNRDKPPSERAASAKLYYWETRELIEYSDDDSRNRMYSPDREDKKHIENLTFIKKWSRFKKMSLIGHIGLLAVSGSVFASFVWYKKRKHISCV